jgi:hypothetical protein
LATPLDDLKVPTGNRLHALQGDRKGQHSISINDQWRICFRFKDGDAYLLNEADRSPRLQPKVVWGKIQTELLVNFGGAF